MTMTLVLITTI